MRAKFGRRGIALVSVLLATVLLLVLVAVLVDLGTVQLQRSTADLRAVEALAGADAGTAWVRGVLELEKGDISATIAHLGLVQGKRRFPIDDRSYVLVSVLVLRGNPQPSGDHLDQNLESNPQVVEQPAQVESSATVFVDGFAVASRTTTSLLRVFPAAPYSVVAGVTDDGGPVGIYSPGDAAGQTAAPDYSELLVKAYTLDSGGNRHYQDVFTSQNWSDNNSVGPGPLP